MGDLGLINFEHIGERHINEGRQEVIEVATVVVNRAGRLALAR